MSLTPAAVLSDEQLLAIFEHSDVITCKCPAYLINLLQQVRAFRCYAADCMDYLPNDRATHLWLHEQAEQLEALLVQIIFELLKREGLLDEQQQPDLQQLDQYIHSNVLQQFGVELPNLKQLERV